MTVLELIRRLLSFTPDTKVVLFADQEGLSAMEPSSVTARRDYGDNVVVCISAWDDHEPDWQPPVFTR